MDTDKHRWGMMSLPLVVAWYLVDFFRKRRGLVFCAWVRVHSRAQLRVSDDFIVGFAWARRPCHQVASDVRNSARSNFYESAL